MSKKKAPKTLPKVGPPRELQPKVLAIDPGNTESGWVFAKLEKRLLGGLRILSASGAEDNLQLVRRLKEFDPANTRLVVETLKPRGMPTSAEEMETLVWIGQFIRQWSLLGGRYSFIFRAHVKQHLCQSTAAKDGNVVAALKDRFGGETVACGGTKCERCKGKKTFGRQLVVCEECQGSKLVEGKKPGSTKRCSGCNGRGERQGDPATCDKCRGSGWKHPPGQLHRDKISSHAWQALGLAVLWADNPVVRQRIVEKIKNNTPRKKKQA